MSTQAGKTRKRRHQLSIELDALKYAGKVYEALDTPKSLACALLLKYGEFAQLVSISADPLHYNDPHVFFLDYQSAKLLSKYPFLKDDRLQPKREAILKFIDAENQCLQTNERFRLRAAGRLFDARVERVLSYASRKIAHILGDVPPLDRMDFSFGPGASYGVRGETSVYNKVTSTLECTYAFARILGDFVNEFPGWFPEGSPKQDVELVPGSELTFVPKNAKTDRPICIEPLLNGLYQKGVGSWIRRRLKSFGVNLDDQSINQRLAGQALTAGLSTVDFSSASDTVAYLLVQDLLPDFWFEALDVARCPRYQFEGDWRNFHKFSSMGNAYTFELESLLFYALACGCCEELGIQFVTGVNLSVYGDDVIIPRDAYDLFQEVTKICGFTVNDDKSFRDGLFFESCGHDFFGSVPVRPFLIKQRLNKLLPAFYAANTLRRIQARLPSHPNRSAVLRRLDDVHSWCVSRIPSGLRAFGPEGMGDGHLICELDEAITSRPNRVRRDRQFDGWWFQSYVERPIKRFPAGGWPMAYALYFTRGEPRGSGSVSHLVCPEPLDNGSGYAVRGRTRVHSARVFCGSEWVGYKPATGNFWTLSTAHFTEQKDSTAA